ncbi:UNVERIFIED_CONTAM: hypothetical protein GTU68_061109 [Idotea baltica]|nr:hypothetical protein [Idotea baltica]
MGVDPGTNITGYGILRCVGNKAELVDYGMIDMRRIKDDHAAKLKVIFERTLSLIEEHLPDEFAIEAPFFGKNVQSMLKLGRAQGVSMAAALFRDIPIAEYAPKKIKMAVTGRGDASKDQVLAMLENILKFKFDSKKASMDASDGIAAAMCHFLQKGAFPTGSGGKKRSTGGSGGGSWESFIRNNPDRLR